ncbi:MAG: type II secretion system F family protein [Firmicutes bacterium]|nr:type II secretion system F family protein [Bacillota bacterium]
MLFNYKAKKKDGTVTIGRIEAVNVNMALDTLAATNLRVLEIKPIKFSVETIVKQFRGINENSVAMMTRRLATMLLAGLALDRSLFILYEQEADPGLKLILQQVLHEIRVGSSLSWALAKHTKAFSNIYISMVKVGEATGEMGSMLNRLADFLERDLDIKRQAKSALTYPAFIFFFCVGVVAVIFIYILPSLMGVFASMSAELPGPTKIMLMIITTVKNPYVQLGVALGIVYYSIYFRDWVRTAHGKYKWDRIKLTIPILSDINRKFIVANFSRALGVLLASGVPLIKSMEILMEFMDNEYFKQLVIQPAYDRVREGQSLSQVLGDTAFFPDMAVQMIAVGESTGELPLMLNKISHFYDVEITYALDTFLNLIEPLMIGVMGLVVCFVLISVFLPLYQVIMNMA